MVRHCAVEDCGNLLIRCGKPIHQFPKDEQLRALWIRLARPSSPAWLPTTSDRLCSYHFRDEDYVRSPRVMESLGFPVRNVQLKPGVLPRLFSKKRRSGERSEPLDKRRRVVREHVVCRVFPSSAMKAEPHVSDLASDETSDGVESLRRATESRVCDERRSRESATSDGDFSLSPVASLGS
ncbi:THAP domain-containing protein 11-like [Ixodes scapularis]